MLQTARTRITGPLLDIVPSVLTPKDFESIAYSSRLLLPVSFPDMVVSHVEYVECCRLGFDSYFECSDLYGLSSLSVLRAFIVEEMLSPSSEGVLALPVGFLHGLLSALALTDCSLALAGLSILTRLTDHLVFLSRGGL